MRFSHTSVKKSSRFLKPENYITRIFIQGNNWDKATLRKLVQSVYPNENDDVIRATTETLMSQFTFGRQDYVTELEFMRLILEFDDSDVVKSCLSYKIIPSHLASQLTDEALSDYMPSPHSGPRGKIGFCDFPFDAIAKMLSKLSCVVKRFMQGSIKLMNNFCFSKFFCWVI